MLSAFLLFVCCCVVSTIAARTLGSDGNVSRAVSSAKCQCYVVSGLEPGYFQYYRFWDFRSVPFDPASLKNYNFYPRIKNGTATAAHDSLSAKNGPFKPILLKDTPFIKDWNIQNWHRKGNEIFPVTVVNSNQNVFITKSYSTGDSTHLVLRTTRNENYSSTAEIESGVRNIFHCSLRVRFRLLSKDESILAPPLGEGIHSQHIQTIPQNIQPASLVHRNARKNPPPDGACAGIFTFNSTVSESDIEILTSDPPNRVHYANQPDYDFVTDQVIDGASIIKDIPIPWTSWATHRLDWFPDASRWYVNNQLQAMNTYGVPNDPSRLIINLWSDGGVWSGNLTVGESVYMGIESIELAYNVSGPYPIYGKGLYSSGRLAMNHLKHTQPEQKENETLRGIFPETKIKSDTGTAKSRACKVGCRIDNVRHDGIPEVLWGFSH
ncbi:Concanavalin A-like lectin/glucanase domain containing protein [Elaphomyces granulatus]